MAIFNSKLLVHQCPDNRLVHYDAILDAEGVVRQSGHHPSPHLPYLNFKEMTIFSNPPKNGKRIINQRNFM